MAKIARNIGFDGRMFLLESEWQTYRRRMPVRYIRKKKEAVCRICGQPVTDDNPFQNAHIISFYTGVVELALTPEFLDSDENIATAHRNSCNKATELNLHASMTHLRSIGVKNLPEFLPEHIHKAWEDVSVQSNGPQ